jgi:hypothetical protein
MSKNTENISIFRISILKEMNRIKRIMTLKKLSQDTSVKLMSDIENLV